MVKSGREEGGGTQITITMHKGHEWNEEENMGRKTGSGRLDSFDMKRKENGGRNGGNQR